MKWIFLSAMLFLSVCLSAQCRWHKVHKPFNNLRDSNEFFLQAYRGVIKPNRGGILNSGKKWELELEEGHHYRFRLLELYFVGMFEMYLIEKIKFTPIIIAKLDDKKNVFDFYFGGAKKLYLVIKFKPGIFSKGGYCCFGVLSRLY